MVVVVADSSVSLIVSMLGNHDVSFRYPFRYRYCFRYCYIDFDSQSDLPTQSVFDSLLNAAGYCRYSIVHWFGFFNQLFLHGLTWYLISVLDFFFTASLNQYTFPFRYVVSILPLVSSTLSALSIDYWVVSQSLVEMRSVLMMIRFSWCDYTSFFLSDDYYLSFFHQYNTTFPSCCSSRPSILIACSCLVLVGLVFVLLSSILELWFLSPWQYK